MCDPRTEAVMHTGNQSWVYIVVTSGSAICACNVLKMGGLELELRGSKLPGEGAGTLPEDCSECEKHCANEGNPWTLAHLGYAQAQVGDRRAGQIYASGDWLEMCRGEELRVEI